MRKAIRRFWQTLVPFYLFVTCILAPGCSCDPPAKALVSTSIPCIVQDETVSAVRATGVTTIVPGALLASLSFLESGGTALEIALDVAEGHGAPAISLTLDSSNIEDYGAGVGVSIKGVDAVTRCPRTTVMDGENRAVHFDKLDAFCAFGNRLVVTADLGDTIHYATWPDKQIRVVGSFAKETESFFEAFLPNGSKLRFGTSAATRPRGSSGIPRAWLAAEVVNPRGQVETSYGYCFANANDVTVEFALDEIRYGNDVSTRTVKMVRRQNEQPRTGYSAGIPWQSSLELQEVQSFGPAQKLAYRYPLEMAPSKTTGRTLLQSVQQCAGDNTCTAPLRLMYAQPKTGFDAFTTNIDKPLSDKASPIFDDFSGDGLPDYLVADTVAQSTATNPITEWRLARNTGNGFATPKVVFLQEWSVQQDPEGPSDPTLLQPELATAIPFRNNGKTSLLLHDVYGNRNNHVILLPKADETFEEHDTGLARPFPLGPTPKGLRSPFASVHLAAVTPDGVPSLIQCDDHGLVPGLSTWILHLWKPDGFESTGTTIEALDGYPCSAKVHTIDWDKNGTVDLVLPGMLKQGGVPKERAKTFYAFSRNSDGTWETRDTKLDVSSYYRRVLLGDFNGDGLSDSVVNDVFDGLLHA